MTKLFKLRGSAINKWLDFYIGVPLLFLLSLFKRRNARMGPAVNALALQFGTIGDAILCIPALNILREHNIHTTVLVSRANQTIFEMAGFETMMFDLSTAIKHPIRSFLLLRSLRQKQVGLIFDFIPWLRLSALIALCIRSKYSETIGFKTPGQLKHFCFDKTVAHRNDCHESENYFELARSALRPSTHIKISLNRLLRPTSEEFSSPYIVLHPWAGGYRATDKEWKLENFFILKDLLPPSWTIYVTGTSENIERAEIFQNQKSFKTVMNRSLKDTATLIQNAEFVVTVNTGILHLSAWLGKNIICLNGPTSTLRWGALTTHAHQKVINLNANTACSPCLNLGFEYACKKMFCMPTISQSSFSDAVRNLVTISLGAEPHKHQYVQQILPPPNSPTELTV